ncbi:ATP synthase F1 subunit epsilon [Armatimonas sp.]|uniref:ATP synthase F1 subunit epsilon n=1 Tax=Armatimonas sp. TaxID=1872638 RepID=UPI00286BBB34|nr:ATP synthase F1 subunit epsilon [Armatimonas sp.]
MAATFNLNIVTPEKTVLSGDVTSVQVPSVEGSLGILAGHAPLLAELGVGECVVRLADGTTRQLVVAGGFLDVAKTKVSVLANTAEFDDEIDVSRAEASLIRARELLSSAESVDRTAIMESMRRAQARIRIAKSGNS